MMEFCDSGSLEQAISERRFWHTSADGYVCPDLVAITLTLLDILSALDHLHQLRITHRDLKAKNILLQSSEVWNADRSLGNLQPSHRMNRCEGTVFLVTVASLVPSHVV